MIMFRPDPEGADAPQLAWSLGQLRHFVAVADHASFGRAADRIGLSQPALSRSIQNLEEALDVQLLRRESVGVTLTPAGTSFLAEARALLAHAQLAQKLARDIDAERGLELRVGMVPLALHTAMAGALAELQRTCPEVTLLVSEMPNDAHVPALRRGEIDIGCCFLSDADRSGLEELEVFRSRVCAAVPADWPLAQGGPVHLSQLAEFPMILFHSPTAPAYHETIVEACREAGFEPRVLHESRQLSTTFAMVERGLGFSIVSGAPDSYPRGGVRLLPLQGPMEALERRVGALWIARSPSRALELFLRILRRQLAAEADAAGA